jgi:LDH2 family malate/lactate/ureidoglycolate dehydrogenase
VGFDQVYYSGQIEGLSRAHRRARGIPIEAGLADELATLGQRHIVPCQKLAVRLGKAFSADQ